MTNPPNWTPNAFFEITRIFVSKTESERTLKFFSDYLLPRVMSDLRLGKKLNYHLFRSLQKGLYRPASWFRGIFSVFLSHPEATIKQAQILAAVLMKTSFPSEHACAVIQRCIQSPFTGPLNVILKILIEKKFALPRKVISSLVDWFVSFQNNPNVKVMPVLWYEFLKSFLKLYGGKFSRPFKQGGSQTNSENDLRETISRTIWP